jgi:hypothetical protein
VSSDRWEKLQEIFIAALQREPGERLVFARQACRGDAPLQAEGAPVWQNRRNTLKRNRCCLKVTKAWEPGKTGLGSRTGITWTAPTSALSNRTWIGASPKRPQRKARTAP